MKRKYLILAIVMWDLVMTSYGQPPTHNPCVVNKSHWSNGLKWSNVFNINEFQGMIRENGKLDSLKLHEAIKRISLSGGGVLFFPQGIYQLSYHLSLMDNVVLRGQISNNKGWLTKFIFPKYIPAYKGNGTPNNTAFKKIVADSSATKNFGLVDIEISGAVIDFKSGTENGFYDNIVIYHLRQNNAAVLDSRFPSKIQQDEKHGWQRWPLWNGDNISVNIKNNLMLSDCKINDSTTYNFPMPNYMTDDGYVFNSDTIYFRYDLHTGIIVTESNESGDKHIEISNNYVYAAKSRELLYLHPGIALYVANKENEKDKVIINEFIKIPKSKAFTYKVGSYIQLYGNTVKDIEDEREILLIDRKFHYSSVYQNNVSEKFKRKIFISTKQPDSLVYFLMSPLAKTDNSKYPLIIFFHGAGEIGAENPLIHFVSGFTKDEIAKKYPCYILVPQLMKTSQSWAVPGERPSKAIQSTLELIDYLKNDDQYKIDLNRTYLAGISYGGSGVFEMLTKAHDFAAAAVVVSNVHNSSTQQLKKMQKVAFQFGGGTRDSSLPIAYMAAMVKKYKNAGIEVRFNEYHLGHFSWIPLIQDPNFYSWLFSKRRK